VGGDRSRRSESFVSRNEPETLLAYGHAVSKPRIGITSSPAVHENKSVEAINRTYVDAVLHTGGLPFLLPRVDPDDVDEVVAGLDGLLLSGGGDIDPAHYGEDPSPHVAGCHPEKDAFELALARAAIDLRLPLLGICRGHQVLNVALGGTLEQHLPDITEVEHRDRSRPAESIHEVVIDRASRLAMVMGTGRTGVNSLHHQAVAQPAPGLRPVAWGDDGVIEAVAGVGSRRALGVQWHPELLLGRPEHRALFDWLVQEATRHPASSDDRRSVSAAVRR
jgi:putative glutamine amidotransferase